MSDAPETIWAFYAPDIEDDNPHCTIVAGETVMHGAAQYTLTSSVAAQIKAAVMAEREACAGICDGEAKDARLHNCATEAIGAVWSAKSIRRRTDTPSTGEGA